MKPSIIRGRCGGQGRDDPRAPVDGNEVVSMVRPGDGFLEGHPDEPHYVTNRGPEPAEALVTFASVEGLPNMVPMQ